MPNESFSEQTRRITAETDAAIDKNRSENVRDWNMIPAEFHATVRHLCRVSYYDGYGAGCTRSTAIFTETLNVKKE